MVGKSLDAVRGRHVVYIDFGCGRSDSTVQAGYVDCGYFAIVDLSKFDGVKAAYFEVVGKTDNVANTWSAQIYDVTGAAAIAGSEKTGTNVDNDCVRSNDILANLPTSEAKLKVQVKVANGGTFTYYGFRLVLEIG